jgi:L-galactonate dehydratase
MTPEQVVRRIDFRYISDALTPDEAVQLLREVEGRKAERLALAERNESVPVYTTSAGWLGFGKERMRTLLQEGLKQGFNKHFKLKVGGDVATNQERLAIAREVIG